MEEWKRWLVAAAPLSRHQADVDIAWGPLKNLYVYTYGSQVKDACLTGAVFISVSLKELRRELAVSLFVVPSSNTKCYGAYKREERISSFESGKRLIYFVEQPTVVISKFIQNVGK